MIDLDKIPLLIPIEGNLCILELTEDYKFSGMPFPKGFRFIAKIDPGLLTTSFYVGRQLNTEKIKIEIDLLAFKDLKGNPLPFGNVGNKSKLCDIKGPLELSVTISAETQLQRNYNLCNKGRTIAKFSYCKKEGKTQIVYIFKGSRILWDAILEELLKQYYPNKTYIGNPHLSDILKKRMARALLEYAASDINKLVSFKVFLEYKKGNPYLILPDLSLALNAPTPTPTQPLPLTHIPPSPEVATKDLYDLSSAPLTPPLPEELDTPKDRACAAFQLTHEQSKALQQLKKALAQCKNAHITFIGQNSTHYAVNGHNLLAHRSTHHIPLKEHETNLEDISAPYFELGDPYIDVQVALVPKKHTSYP